MSVTAGDESGRDYPLTPDEIDQLLRELARAFNTEDRALVLLRSVRFPRELIPEFGITGSLNFWTMIFNDLDNGVVEAPYRRLITGALSIFAAHQGLTSLQRKYQETQATTPPPAPQPTSATPVARVPTPQAHQEATARVTGCHVIVRTADERVRERIWEWLEAELLEPRHVWSAHEMTSFAVNETDHEQVRTLINGRYARLLVKVVPPGQPDELLEVLRVSDAYGRELAVPSVPIQLTVAELAAVAARFHPAALSASTRTVGGRRRAETAIHAGAGITQQVPLDGTLLQWGFGDDHKVTIKSLEYQKIRVVFVGASPRGKGDERLGEIRVNGELEAIRRMARLGHITLAGDFTHATRTHLAEIMQRDPDILHIACHGKDGRLFWEDDDGDADDVSADWLAERILERAGHRLGGIMLSACDGESTGPFFTEAAREVIAHKGRIADNLAIDFTTRFYDELARVPVLSTVARRADMHGTMLIFPPNAQGGL